MRDAHEQQIYARWLDWGTHIGLAVLAISFLVYALALLEPLVPLERLPAVWTLPVERYIASTGAPTGWGWVFQLGKGDYLNLLGVALLGLATAVCYVRMLVIFLQRGERLQAALAAVQIAVLLAAASGLLAGGH